MDLDLTGRDAAILIQALAGVLPRAAHPQRRAELCRKLAGLLRDDPACMANAAYAPALALAGRVQDAAAAWAGYSPPQSWTKAAQQRAVAARARLGTD